MRIRGNEFWRNLALLLGLVLKDSLLLISGSLVRAQQAEPITKQYHRDVDQRVASFIGTAVGTMEVLCT